MRIFLDACIIIYWVEAALPYYSTLISKLESISSQYPIHTITVSRLSILECLVKPLRNKEAKIVKVYQQFFESPDLSIIEIDHKVIELATLLRAEHNLRTPDAIQAASCLSTESQHLFLTNDKRLTSVNHLNIFQL